MSAKGNPPAWLRANRPKKLRGGGSRSRARRAAPCPANKEKGLRLVPQPLMFWRPQGDSNPRCRRERAVSLAGLDDGDGAVSLRAGFSNPVPAPFGHD